MSEPRDLYQPVGPATADGESTPPPLGGPHRRSPGRGIAWLTESFGWFRAAPLGWIVAVILLVVLHTLLQTVPLLGAIASLILGPVFTGGLMIGCRAQEEGLGFEIGHLFAGFSRNAGSLAAVGAAYLGMIVAISLVVGLWMFVLGGAASLAALQSTPAALSAAQVTLAVVGLLIGLALFVPALAAIWLAPPLVALHDVPALAAMRMSLAGCLGNLPAFLLYGVLLLILAVLAAIPFMLGFLILLPMMIISIYTAYRDIYTDTPARSPA